MLRRILAVALVALPAAAPSLSAQEYTWNPDRPDAWASPGILGDRTLSSGEAQIWYRFHDGTVEGIQFGKEEIDGFLLLDVYPIVPLRRSSQIHEGGIAFSPFGGLTLSARGSWIQYTLDEVSSDELFTSTSSGIGDVEVEALVDVYSQGPFRAHAGMGVSIPTGSIDEQLVANGNAIQLPYAMQTGSGTVDLFPSAAVLAMNEMGSVGARIRGTIRFMDNDRGYRLPQGVELAAWGARQLNHWFSVSGGVVFEHFGQIKGEDADLDLAISPVEDPSFTGGTFVDIPLGINLFVRDGLLAGNRFGVEARWPVSQDAEGPQLRRDRRITARWQRAVSLF